ncbi:MAG: hypothetical protein J2P27_07860 [Actinobacteria bacterium]|nr:hypothetical protein [Actinomycetota bacterium]
MTGWAGILVSGASGAVVTLVGVVTGSVIASRSQRRQWLRDKQVDACAVVVQESTAMQLALLRQRKLPQQRLDWTAWNQALAMIWLVGTPGVREAAKQMDRAFWLCGAQIKSGLLAAEDAWVEQRDAMELARRDFINAARREPVGERQAVSDVPVARPPLTEIRQMLRSPDVPGHQDAAQQHEG